MEWIADYRVLGDFDDPARSGVRVDAAPPTRLGLADPAVVVEVVEDDPARLAAWLGPWAAAASGVDTLAVPLEVGPVEGGSGAWVARRTGTRTGLGTLPAVAATASGLAALHAAGGTHGSLTPGRIIATSRSGVLDLPPIDPEGSALVVMAPDADALDTLAPEVLRGEVPTPASDVWSLGVCIVRAVRGRPAHPGIDGDVLLAAVGRVATERPDASAAGAELSSIVAACLSMDPGERPAASDVAAELQRYARATS